MRKSSEPPRRTERRLGRTVLRAAAGLLALGSCATGCATEQAQNLAFLNHDPAVEYVGQEACRQCHFEKFGTYVKTGMGRSFYPMTPEVAVEDFTDQNEFVVEPSGLHYRMEQRDGKYYQRQFMRDSKGREVAVDEHEMVWVVGSNHHSRSYIITVDGKLFQAPACWYPEASRWDLCPGYEFKNDHFGREISRGCLHCHNGKMRQVEGERNKFEEPFPHGIGCERCHGPGQLHVQRWTSGKDTPSGALDLTIVHPRRLPPEERIEVCFQCHLGDSKATERVARHQRDLEAFRPGQLLTEVVVPLHYKQQSQYEFGLSSQADRLILSRCYKESGGKIECLTCHNPHITVYHEDRPGDFFRQPCLTCHQVESCPAPWEERQRTEPADNCVSCHMRKAEPDDQRYTEFTDHWIRRDIDVGPDHRDDYDVEPVFPQRFAALSPGEQAYYRARAISLLARDAPMSVRPKMWLEAERAFKDAIDNGFDTADSWFFLGKTLSYMGKKDAAAEAFARAVAHDPAHHDAAFAHGQAMFDKGELDSALAVFQGMLERNPDNAMALAEAGRTRMSQGNIADALAFYQRALRREPWSASLHMNTGMLLAALGRFEEAMREAEAATRLDPDNPEVWRFYEKVMRATGRMQKAAEGRLLVGRLSTG